jgi:hypothetical protein
MGRGAPGQVVSSPAETSVLIASQEVVTLPFSGSGTPGYPYVAAQVGMDNPFDADSWVRFAVQVTEDPSGAGEHLRLVGEYEGAVNYDSVLSEEEAGPRVRVPSGSGASAEFRLELVGTESELVNRDSVRFTLDTTDANTPDSA